MPDLTLNREELSWLVNFFPGQSMWPRDPAELRCLPIGEQEIAYGSAVRLKIIAAYQLAMAAPVAKPLTVSLPLTLSECWLLDTVCWQSDYRQVTMGNGTPIMRLVEKVWAALGVAQYEQIPAHLRGQSPAVKVVEPTEAAKQHQRDTLAYYDRLAQ